MALHGEVVQRDVAGNALAVGCLEQGEYRLRFPGLATFAFQPGESEVLVAAASTTPRHVVEDLLRSTVLPLKLQAEGYEALHASAVQMAGSIVAFCGYSGAGKTTIAYALSQRGYGLWADDAVVLSLPVAGEKTVSCLRVPQAVNLRSDSRRFFGLQNDADVEIGAWTSGKGRLAAAVVLAPDAENAGQMELLPLDAALTELLPHAFCFLAETGRQQRTASAYLELATLVPVFRFRYPSGFAHFGAALDVLETRLREAVAGS